MAIKLLFAPGGPLLRSLITLAGVSVVALTGLVPFVSAAQAAPSSTESYYVDTFDPQHWYNLGQAQGQADLAWIHR